MKRERITLPIYNLGCGGGGALAIERTLTKAPGVVYAYVNPLTEMAYVEFDPALVNPRQLAALIDKLGYGAPPVVSRGERATIAVQPARAQWDTRRLAMVAGLALAAIYALGLLGDLLFPSLFQTYRFWENVLIGVAWATPWSLLIGLIETFLMGVLVIWAGMALYQALPGQSVR
jgi:cation transport ATPase